MRNDTLINIVIDREATPYFSTDQMYIRTPVVFPTMNIELVDTTGLNWEADKIRMANGHAPCFGDPKEWGVPELDCNGFYRFIIRLCGVWPGCENCVHAQYIGDDSEIDEFQIELKDDQRLALFTLLNEQCCAVLGGCAVYLMQEYAKEIGLKWKDMMTV